MHHSPENNDDSVLSQTERTDAAIAAAITVAKKQATERDSQLLIAAMATSIRAIQTKQTEDDGKHILTAVQYAGTVRVDLPSSILTSETDRTKAAIKAVIKVAKNQESREGSLLLVRAIVAATRAVQNEDTERDAELIIIAVQAASPDREEVEARIKAANKEKEKMIQEQKLKEQEIQESAVRKERARVARLQQEKERKVRPTKSHS